jgi:hypothetical protein
MIEQSKLESTIHHYLVRGLIDDGFAPDIARLQELVTVDAASVREVLKRLEASHSCHARKQSEGRRVLSAPMDMRWRSKSDLRPFHIMRDGSPASLIRSALPHCARG